MLVVVVMRNEDGRDIQTLNCWRHRCNVNENAMQRIVINVNVTRQGDIVINVVINVNAMQCRAISVLLGEAWKSLAVEDRELYSGKAKVTNP